MSESLSAPFNRSDKLRRSPIKSQVKNKPDKKYPLPIQIKTEQIDIVDELEETYLQDYSPTNLNSPITLEHIKNNTGNTLPTGNTIANIPIQQTENYEPIHKDNTDMARKIATEIFSLVMSSLPEFKGADAENPCNDLKNFIAKAEWTRTNMIDEANYNTFDQVILFKLTGDAQRKTQTKRIQNFDELKETLHRIYSTTDSLEEVRTNFFQCKQKEYETTNEFGQRIINAMEIYTLSFETKYESKLDAANLKDLTEQALSIFKKGLINTQLKIQLISTRKDKLEELIQEAIIIEKLISDAETWNVTGTSQPPLPLTKQPRIMQPQSLPPTYMQQTQYQQSMPNYQQQMIQQQQPHDQQTYQQPQFQGSIHPEPNKPNMCHYCGKPNHIWKECREYKQDQYTRSTNTNTNQTQKTFQNNTPKYCAYCKKRGHDISECNNKKRSDERRQTFANNNSEQMNKNQKTNFQKPQQYYNQPQNPQYYNQPQKTQYYNQPQKPPYYNQQQNKQYPNQSQKQPWSNQQQQSPPRYQQNNTWKQTFQNQNYEKENNQQPIEDLGNEMGKMKIFTTEQNMELRNNPSENSNGSVTDM